MHCSNALPGLPQATQPGLERVTPGGFTDFVFDRFLSGALESGLTLEASTAPALSTRSLLLLDVA